jgi:DNA-binding NtrC family response regulator
MTRVLIVDDEVQLIKAFKKQLTEDGLSVVTATCAKDALSLLKEQTFDVAVLDIKLPDLDGVELLLRMKQAEPTVEVVMLTGYASVDTAIRSMKLGAYDYLTKPCKIAELEKVILKAHENKSLKEKNIVLEEHLHRIGAHDDFIGRSREIMKVKELISVVAASGTPVLIVGETGAGKEVAARAIHDLSGRAGNPFVTINASALQETILESELFGYKRGAFTGAHSNKLGLLEIAHNGTFFIDEVGDMGMTIQAKILRVLETSAFMKLGDTKETKVDARFIFATNKELKSRIAEGLFRKDLFFRINGFIINLPPLRERKSDIPLLAEYFLDKFARGGKRKRLSPEAAEWLVAYEWPGNVRELANVIERSLLLSGARDKIVVDDFPESMQAASAGGDGERKQGNTFELAQLEEEHIEKALRAARGNKSKAAHLLGISRKTLYNKLAKGRNGRPG